MYMKYLQGLSVWKSELNKREGRYLKRHESNQCGKTVGSHETNIFTLITHSSQHWYHQEYHVRDHAHAKSFDDTWHTAASQGQ